MKLIVGLGNPGRPYSRTRHNLGFMTVDRLAGRWGIEVPRGKGLYWLGRGTVAGRAVGLLKPMTFMNCSGQAVLDALHFYKVPPENLLVIFDDLDLPVGRVRVRGRGSSGGHKGLDDVIAHLGGDRFARVRIGIDKPAHGDTVAYVLSRFTEQEQPLIDEAIDRAADAAERWLHDGPQAAMNRYNRPVRDQAGQE